MRNPIAAITALSLVAACSSSSVTTHVIESDGGASAAGGAVATGSANATNNAGAGVGGVSGAGASSGASSNAAAGSVSQAGGASAGAGGQSTSATAAGGAFAFGGAANGGQATIGGAATAGSNNGGAGKGGAGGTAIGGAGTGGAGKGGTGGAGKGGTGGAGKGGTGGTAIGGAATGGAAPNPCATQPCLNGGTCNVSGASYTCQCAVGYNGTTCATNINDCLNVTCSGHGTCVDGVNTHTCQCAAGYSGTACATAVAPTVTQQPQSGTVCLGTSATFSVAATGAGTLTYQWKQLASGVSSNVGTGPSLSISTVSGAGSATPPYTNTYYVVVTDSANGATAQSTDATLTVNPIPSSVRINQWGTNDHVWIEFDSREPDLSCSLAVIYRYSNDAGGSWTAWANDNYCYWWPNVGPLGLPSGAIRVQAYVTNGYGCNSSITQGSYIF